MAGQRTPDAADIAVIAATVARHNGNVTAAARELDWSWHTINRHAGAVAPPVEASETVTAATSPDSETTEQFIRRMLADREARKTNPEVVQAPPTKFDPPGKTRIVQCPKQYERVVWLSDLHHPFLDRPAFAVAMQSIRDYRPDLVILGGDAFDCYSISDHDKEPGRVDTLQDEFDDAQPTWKEIDSLGCDVVFIKGNHEERIDRMQRKNPGLFRLRSMEMSVAAELPKRWLCFPDQTQYQLGSLTCHHGNLRGRGTNSVHAAKGMLDKLRTTVLHGHLHRFQSFYKTGHDGTVNAGFSSGHLSDVNAATYLCAPDWQSGYSTVDVDWSLGIFSVTPHLIVRNALRIGSKTYSV